MHGVYGIDRFLNVKSAISPSWSPDGQNLAFLMNLTGSMQVWSVPREGGWPEQLTFLSDRIMEAAYSPTDDRLLVLKDNGGDERAQLYSLSADGSEMTALCPAPGSMDAGVWSPDGRQIAFHSNRRSPAFFDLYQVQAEGGEPELLLEHDGTNRVGVYSPDGRYLLFTRHQASLVNGLYLLDLQTRYVRALTDGDTIAYHGQVQWAPDSRGLYLVCDKDREFRGLAFLSLESGSLEWLATPEWDVEELKLSPDGTMLAYTVNSGGRSELWLRDQASGQSRPVEVPQGVIAQLSWAPGSDALAFALAGYSRPANIWVCDLPSGRCRQLTRAPIGGIPVRLFSEARLVSYRSFDGLEIPAWFALPNKGRSGGGLPVIVSVHGGPEGQARGGFNEVSQYFLSRGYAIFAPNVRGSMGYGKSYTHLDDRRKRMDSVADLAACVPYLASTGYVDPRRIAVMGGSYGGFMVLAALTHYPDLWAAGVDIVGIANLETFLENTGSYRRKLRESEYGSLSEDREFFREISPIWHVEKIRAPLFVAHGANDPRVPVSEAEQIVSALESRGRPVEYLRFNDEGHGIVKLPNRLRLYPAIADFLDRHLNQRG